MADKILSKEAWLFELGLYETYGFFLGTDILWEKDFFSTEERVQIIKDRRQYRRQ